MHRGPGDGATSRPGQSLAVALGLTGYSGARQAAKRLKDALKRLRMPLEQVWVGMGRLGPRLVEGGRTLKRLCVERAPSIEVRRDELGSVVPRRRRTRTRARRRPSANEPAPANSPPVSLPHTQPRLLRPREWSQTLTRFN